MVIYLLGVIVVSISVFAFYLYLKFDNNKKSEARLIDFSLSSSERKGYVDAAYRCRKNNSPISDDPFHTLYLSGADKVNKESFVVYDWEKKDGAVRVIRK